MITTVFKETNNDVILQVAFAVSNRVSRSPNLTSTRGHQLWIIRVFHSRHNSVKTRNSLANSNATLNELEMQCWTGKNTIPVPIPRPGSATNSLINSLSLKFDLQIYTMQLPPIFVLGALTAVSLNSFKFSVEFVRSFPTSWAWLSA